MHIKPHLQTQLKQKPRCLVVTILYKNYFKEFLYKKNWRLFYEKFSNFIALSSKRKKKTLHLCFLD